MSAPANLYEYCKAAFRNAKVASYVKDAIKMVNGDQTITASQTSSAYTLTTLNVGAKNGSTVTAVERGSGILHQTVLTLTATPITITDDAGVAQYGGTGKIYDFPEGHIATLGAVCSGSLTLGTTGTIINTWSGVCSLGSATATTGATLVGTEADIMKSNTVSAATAKVATIDAVTGATVLTESGASWFDGTATALDLYFNLAVADDASHTSGTGTYTGVITVTWMYFGDN